MGRTRKNTSATTPAANAQQSATSAPSRKTNKKQQDVEAAAQAPQATNVAPAVVPSDPVKRANPGVLATARTRPYAAGKALAIAFTKGLSEIGVTSKALVDAVDAEYGANPRETRFALRNGYHAIRGFCEAMGIDPTTGKPVASK